MSLPIERRRMRHGYKIKIQGTPGPGGRGGRFFARFLAGLSEPVLDQAVEPSPDNRAFIARTDIVGATVGEAHGLACRRLDIELNGGTADSHTRPRGEPAKLLPHPRPPVAEAAR